jgi:hypothetical protein
MRVTSSIIRLANYILSLDYFIFTTIVILLSELQVYPNPPCQLSLWEETGAPGENVRLSTERSLFL